jgi:hypothetical protein
MAVGNGHNAHLPFPQVLENNFAIIAAGLTQEINHPGAYVHYIHFSIPHIIYYQGIKKNARIPVLFLRIYHHFK